MNQEQLKDLAEWSAEFLGFEVRGGVTGDSFYCREVMEGGHSYDTSIILDSPKFAAYFMHLGKREMEKREWLLESINLRGFDKIDLDGDIAEKGKYKYHYKFFKGTAEAGIKYNENEYIAFWTAVREALK